MDINTLLPDPKAVRLILIQPSSHLITLVVKAIADTSVCPLCHCPSNRVHSSYTRTVADLPWHGIAIRLRLHTRKFFCKQQHCPRRVFCERLPGVVATYARHSIRLNQLLELIGFVIGGQSGARAAAKMALKVSPDTLVRRVRRAAKPSYHTPGVLGVDDWAFRRNKTYGTILVDLELHKVIDLLPDRDAKTVAGWLEKHSGVEIISRDRATAYAEAARTAAPLAQQVADRWHLLKNLTEALERVLQNRSSVLGAAASVIAQAQVNSSPAVIEAGPTTMLSSRDGKQACESRKRRYTRYKKVMRLYRKGVSIRSIAKVMKMSRMTAYKYIEADCFPERAPSRSRGSALNKYLSYVHRRWAEGCNNATQMWREIVEQGYKGEEAMVRRYVGRLRVRLKALPAKEQLKIEKLDTAFRTPSPRGAVRLLLKEEKDLKEDERGFTDQLTQLCPEVNKAKELARRFQKMIKQREADELDGWIEAATASQVKELEGFAEGLKKDREAVRGSLQYEWSNGQVEGQVNRLKLIKRQMYGRAKFDLLKAKVLYSG
jgi:transposase